MLKKYVNSYKSIPIQARASFWFLVCGILQNGLNIITLPVFTRVLTEEQYGLSSTFFAWNDLLTVVCTLRLSYGVFDKGLLKYGGKRDSFESSLLGLTTTLSVIMLALYLLFHDMIQNIFGMSFILCLSLFINQIFAPALLFWTARNKFEYKYQKFTAVTIVTAIVSTLLNLMAVLTMDYDRGTVKILSYQLIWCIVYIIFYVYIFARGKTFYQKDMWAYALKFNIPLIPYFLSTLILDKADRIMIDNFCGKSYVALYSVSYNLGRLMVLLTSALDATITPWMYQKIKEERYDNCKKITTSILAVFIIIATGFMIFAPELVTLFAAPEYKEAVYVIPPVIASYFFVMLYQVVAKVEFYYERTKTIASVTLAAAVLDIILNYFAIPKFGYIAAGYTTLISYITMALFHMAVSYKLAKEKNIQNKIFSWGKLLLLGIVMILITIFVNLLYRWVALRFLILAAIIIAAFIFKKKIISILYTLKKRE